jgi:hypothetical protein
MASDCGNFDAAWSSQTRQDLPTPMPPVAGLVACSWCTDVSFKTSCSDVDLKKEIRVVSSASNGWIDCLVI